jgi:hypothetical protein
MPKLNASIVLDESPKKLTGWEMAIKDAERRIRALKAALVLFKQRRDAGEPWPGTVESPDQSSQPSGG